MNIGADNLFKKLRSVIVAEPTYYEINEPLNTWQEKYQSQNLDVDLAIRQHQNMVKAMEGLGVKCHYLKSIPGATEQKDVRDLGVITSKGAIIGHFNHSVRIKEVSAFIEFLSENNIEILKYGMPFEGGDFFLYDETTCLVGSGNRSNIRVDELKSIIDKDVLILNHVSSHHLDALFNIISKDLVVMNKGYIADNIFTKKMEVVEIDEKDVEEMSANFIVIDEGIILAEASCQLFNERLRRKGIKVHEVDLSELKKNGGSIRCMTLPLLRS